MDKQEVLSFLTTNKQYLKEKYKVAKIGLFGSYAKDIQNENSDIDILVEMPSSFDGYYDLKEYLESNLNHKVDLGTQHSIRDLIKKKIQSEIIYA
ncbi:MAG: nucleotidyltransferase family protein [Planctomycetota bacterium]|jgi:predicted nucleotidyltransferase